MATPESQQRKMEQLDVPLDRDVFTRDLIRHLAGTLEDTIGIAEAAGFISLVGQSIGEKINEQYHDALGKKRLTRTEVAAVLVDLKRRIQGDFRVIEQNDAAIVFGNRACPFGDKVIGRRSMCMMTSNVFGLIASENLGYSKVELQETIAEGSSGCRVVVHLRKTRACEEAEGLEYHRVD